MAGSTYFRELTHVPNGNDLLVCSTCTGFSSVQFSLVQGGTFALENAHMRSTPSLRCFSPNVAFETLYYASFSTFFSVHLLVTLHSHTIAATVAATVPPSVPYCYHSSSSAFSSIRYAADAATPVPPVSPPILLTTIHSLYCYYCPSSFLLALSILLLLFLLLTRTFPPPPPIPPYQHIFFFL